MQWGGSQRRWLVPIASAAIVPALLAFGAGSALATSIGPSIEGTTASHVTATDATLEATIDPHGASAGVFYQFQLLLDPGEAPTEIHCPSRLSGYSTCAGTPDAGALPLGWISGASAQAGTVDLSSAGVVLQPGRTYFFRVLAADRKFNEDVAEWEPPATVGETREFTTGVLPSISQESASNVTATDATLHAVVDDHGLAATYRFQIAKAPACLPVKPPYTPCAKVETGNLPQGSLPAADGPQAVSLDLGTAGISLEPGAKYSFRLVASSSAGDSEGPDETFATQPGTKRSSHSPFEPEWALEGGIHPRTLPKKSRKPIFLNLKGRVSGGRGDLPLGFKAMTLEFDKDGAIFTKGLPTCRYSPTPDIGWGADCPEALIGRGTVHLDIALPEQPPYATTSPLEIYNGVPKDGHPVLLYRVYAHVPAAATFVVSAPVEPHHGKFGTTTTIQIPKIVSGHGALTGFSARIGKTWTYRGRKVSLLSARCPRGSLAMKGDMELTDGTVVRGELTSPCGPKR